MASNTAILAIKVVSDTKTAQRGLDDLDKSADRAAKGGLKAASIAAAAVGVALVGMAMKAVDAASQLQQSTGAVQAVYGEYADDVIAKSKQAADAIGLSASAYQNLSSVLGSQLKNAGVPMDQIAGQTDELIRLGSDLAATYGGSVADAVSAVSSLLRGERDPIERYAVSINQATIDAYNAARGLDNLTGSAKQQADQQAALALLWEQTAAAQGQFGREADTLAGQQERLNAKWTDAQAALGTALLPVMSLAAELLGQLATWVTENQLAFQILIGLLGLTAAAVWAVNIAMYANPVGLVIVAIGLLIAIIVVLIANWEQIADVAADVWGSVIDWIQSVGDWFESVFASIGDWWDQLMADFAAGFDALFGWINDAIGWFLDLIGVGNQAPQANVSAVAAAAVPLAPEPSPMARGLAAPALFTGSSLVTSAAARPEPATVINITVNGALDPDAVGRQLYGILRKYGGRVGFGPASGVRG